MWIKRFLGQGLALCVVSGNLAHAASALDAYLLKPTELTAECSAIPGSFPAGPKIAALYQYTAYQSVLPKLTDRHAQSFQCGPQKGSIFFFQYGTTVDKEAAALFAKPVLSKEAVGWVDWPTGFAVVSFKDVPASLMNSLQAKAKGSATFTTMSPAVATPPAAPMPAPVVTPAVTTMASSTAGYVPPATVPSTPSISQAPVGKVADMSDIALDTLIGSVGCDNATQSETKKVCAWLNDFKTGRIPGSSIASDATVVGQAYRIDSYGRLSEKFIDVLVGNGQPGGLALFGIQPTNGLEDYEAQALVEARMNNKPLPSNSMSARVAKLQRPPSVGVIEAGSSWALTSEGAENRTFLRKQKDGRWMVLSVAGDNPDEQTRASFVIAALY